MGVQLLRDSPIFLRSFKVILTSPVPGGHPDVCFHNGLLHYTYQDNSTLHVITPGADLTYDLGTDVLAFPRLKSLFGHLYVLYREGASRGGHAVLLCDGVKVHETPFECGGNNPVSFGVYNNQQVIACVERNTQTVHIYTVQGLTHSTAGTVPGTGIAYIDGRIVSWDENYGALLPLMTAPCAAGRYVVGEHPVRGALLRHPDTGKELILFPNEYANTPRIAIQNDIIAVCTWGPPGVRVATLNTDELTTPTTLYPPGVGWTRRADITSINLNEYLFVPNFYARQGAPIPLDGVVNYTHLMQSRPLGTGVQITKQLGTAVKSATFTRSADGKFWGLPWDATDGKNGYQIVIPATRTTAQLYPNVMSVGETHMRRVNVDILTQNGNRTNATWKGYVEGVYEGPQIGDIPAGLYANIVWDFEDQNGFREFNLCRQHMGPVVWTEVRKSTSATRRWFGTFNTPRIDDPIPQQTMNLPANVLAELPPGVQIQTYQKVIKNGWNGPIVEVRNQNQPDELVVVEVIDGSLHVYWKNAYGFNRSGLKRPIRFET